MPGDDPGGVIITIIIGVVGAVIGGFVALQLGYSDITGFDLRSFVIAVIGALVLLAGYRLLRRSSTRTCPAGIWQRLLWLFRLPVVAPPLTVKIIFRTRTGGD
jgi:uncharacterized membrane protein YeaQ/YmgE (transglycosylase-associated protein family)